MSRNPGDPPPPPRRPKPRPAPPPEDDGDGPSTFQPNPGAGPARAPRAAKPGPIDDEVGARGAGVAERVRYGGVSSGDLATFCRQSASYLDAGVDLAKTLGSLQTQLGGSALAPVCGRLREAVRRGEDLATAVSREPKAFDGLFRSMIRVAEARGGLPETLRRMAAHYEARQRLARQARSALIYPVIVTTIALAVMWLLTTFVLPKLVAILADMTRGNTAGLPGPTRALIAMTNFLTSFGWWAVPLGLGVGAFLLVRWYRTAAGRAALGSIALRLPVFGGLLRQIETTRFARVLGALLDAGVDYGAAMDLTAGAMQIAPMQAAVQDAKRDVLAGKELSGALAKSGHFPVEALALIETGEETGQLPECLDRLANATEEQVAYKVKNLGSLVQPLILIVLGGFAFFIAIAFVSAYVSVLTGLANG
jgi:type II secretory pathway component PulF